MPERLLIGPGSPPSIDPVYPELSPPPEPCQKHGLTSRPLIRRADRALLGSRMLRGEIEAIRHRLPKTGPDPAKPRRGEMTKGIEFRLSRRLS